MGSPKQMDNKIPPAVEPPNDEIQRVTIAALEIVANQAKLDLKLKNTNLQSCISEWNNISNLSDELKKDHFAKLQIIKSDAPILERSDENNGTIYNLDPLILEKNFPSSYEESCYANETKPFMKETKAIGIEALPQVLRQNDDSITLLTMEHHLLREIIKCHILQDSLESLKKEVGHRSLIDSAQAFLADQLVETETELSTSTPEQVRKYLYRANLNLRRSIINAEKVINSQNKIRWCKYNMKKFDIDRVLNSIERMPKNVVVEYDPVLEMENKYLSAKLEKILLGEKIVDLKRDSYLWQGSRRLGLFNPDRS